MLTDAPLERIPSIERVTFALWTDDVWEAFQSALRVRRETTIPAQ